MGFPSTPFEYPPNSSREQLGKLFADPKNAAALRSKLQPVPKPVATVPQIQSPQSLQQPRNVQQPTQQPNFQPVATPKSSEGPTWKQNLNKFLGFFGSPGGSQILAQLGELFAGGDPTLTKLARGAQGVARGRQYEQIQSEALAGLTPDFSVTAGLQPGEAQQVAAQALQQRQQSQEFETKQAAAQAQTGLAQAQAAEIQRKPQAEALAAESDLTRSAISSGVQTYMSNGKQKSYRVEIENGKPKIVDLGESPVQQRGAIDAGERARLDQSSYDRAVRRANEQAQAEGLGELTVYPDGSSSLNIKREDQERSLKRLKQLQLEQVTQFTKEGLIKDPAYLKAALGDIAPVVQDARGVKYKFTGTIRNGKPQYQDDKGNVMELND